MSGMAEVKMLLAIATTIVVKPRSTDMYTLHRLRSFRLLEHFVVGMQGTNRLQRGQLTGFKVSPRPSKSTYSFAIFLSLVKPLDAFTEKLKEALKCPSHSNLLMN